ncbi:unnamed protein product [Oncorhynchus mykiss]|uniref:Root UVB sensitive protein C-terminal domain-containing protein n=1 Tax=Oncorhynchus mykiss TaxID=8022 RepID=A0A060XAQ1_ONCMY|nr:unnamed protein product [Oncorhynchus mykiss]
MEQWREKEKGATVGRLEKPSLACSKSEDLNLAMKNNHKPFLIGVKRGSVCACLGPDASVCDEIRAVCQAVCLCTVLHPVSPLEGALKQLSMSHSNNHWELVHESHKLMDQIFQPFLKAVTCQDAPDWGHGTSGRVRGAGTGRTGLGKRTSWESARRRHMMYRTGEVHLRPEAWNRHRLHQTANRILWSNVEQNTLAQHLSHLTLSQLRPCLPDSLWLFPLLSRQLHVYSSSMCTFFIFFYLYLTRQVS